MTARAAVIARLNPAMATARENADLDFEPDKDRPESAVDAAGAAVPRDRMLDLAICGAAYDPVPRACAPEV
ncbi:MAG TPA: hypothetical protein DEQ40_02535 [Oxalobacteraceae bacterium]|nr:hypothetical protein [Oxalobacteraceae bacterium]